MKKYVVRNLCEKFSILEPGDSDEDADLERIQSHPSRRMLMQAQRRVP
jgi:hypothetical protein